MMGVTRREVFIFPDRKISGARALFTWNASRYRTIRARGGRSENASSGGCGAAVKFSSGFGVAGGAGESVFTGGLTVLGVAGP